MFEHMGHCPIDFRVASTAFFVGTEAGIPNPGQHQPVLDA